MPPLFRADKRALFETKETERNLTFPDGFLVRNLEELAYLKERVPGAVLIADANLYSWSQEARTFLKEQGFSADTAPLELNSHELSRRGLSGSELVVYGRAALMLSSQCVKRTTGNCNKKERIYLSYRPEWQDFSCLERLFGLHEYHLQYGSAGPFGSGTRDPRAGSCGNTPFLYDRNGRGSRENRRNLRPALPFRGSCFYEASGVYPGAF